MYKAWGNQKAHMNSQIKMFVNFSKNECTIYMFMFMFMFVFIYIYIYIYDYRNSPVNSYILFHSRALKRDG